MAFEYVVTQLRPVLVALTPFVFIMELDVIGVASSSIQRAVRSVERTIDLRQRIREYEIALLMVNRQMDDIVIVRQDQWMQLFNGCMFADDSGFLHDALRALKDKLEFVVFLLARTMGRPLPSLFFQPTTSDTESSDG